MIDSVVDSRPASRWRSAVVLIAAVTVVVVTARLGIWQLDRASQKQALQRTLDERSALPPLAASELAETSASAVGQFQRRIELRGRWIESATVFLENRQMNARTGFDVVTPLQPEGPGAAVLVQRGWYPRDLLDRTRLPVVAPEPGIVTVVGRIAPPPGRLYEFAGAASGPIRQNLDVAAFSRELARPLRPLSIVQDQPSGSSDVLMRQWPQPGAGVARHHGYAFQWFALSALMTGLYVWFQIIRPRRGPGHPG
jgi:surfeit locus 1 family protein